MSHLLLLRNRTVAPVEVGLGLGLGMGRGAGADGGGEPGGTEFPLCNMNLEDVLRRATRL
jgi:hypothetical protein